MFTKEEIRVGLVCGRHSMPVDEYIFDSIEDVLDFASLDKRVCAFIEERVGLTRSTEPGLNQMSYEDVLCCVGSKSLVVYVTGLTAATAAVIACCARCGVNLTLMHFDASTGEYKAQKLF